MILWIQILFSVSVFGEKQRLRLTKNIMIEAEKMISTEETLLMTMLTIGWVKIVEPLIQTFPDRFYDIINL